MREVFLCSSGVGFNRAWLVPDLFDAETGKSVFLGGPSRFRRVERVSTMVESYSWFNFKISEKLEKTGLCSGLLFQITKLVMYQTHEIA